LFLTLLLGGLWHGAAWHFVLWGAFHGLLLGAARALSSSSGKPKLDVPRWLRLVQTLAFFHITCLGWALFRAPTLEGCAVAWRKLCLLEGLELRAWLAHLAEIHEMHPVAIWFGVFVIAWLLQYLYPRSSKELVAQLWRLPMLPRAFAIASLTYLVMLLSPLKPPAFIYFQF
jgi:alginate O-acetyltransferase complex protein AlgI